MNERKARICCLDMDTFFVSVERVLDPFLVGKPVIVGGAPGSRGVVTACSYEVRALGVRSGMSLTQAGKLAPRAHYLPVRHDTYGEYARRVRRIAEDFSPVIQVASIDEMFIDFSGCESLYRRNEDRDDDETIERTVRVLTARIRSELGLPSSAGIAASRSMAKVASGLAKPAGVRLVPVGSEPRVLAPLPVRKLPGIGPVAERKLHAVGILTLGELAAAPAALVARTFGAWAEHVTKTCRGLGSSSLDRNRPAFQEFDPEGEFAGTLSNERTFHEDIADDGRALRELSALCERVCYRARKRGVCARTLQLKLRYSDFHTTSRSKSFAPTCSELVLWPVVKELYASCRTRRLPLRLVGVCLSNLCPPPSQLSLFGGGKELHTEVDRVRQRFGYDALHFAASRRPSRKL